MSSCLEPYFDSSSDPTVSIRTRSRCAVGGSADICGRNVLAIHVQAAGRRRTGTISTGSSSRDGRCPDVSTTEARGVCRIAKYSVTIPAMRPIYSVVDSSDARPVDFS